MLDFLGNLTGVDKFFLLCAVLGGALFAVRTVMLFLGAGEHGGGDFDAGGAPDGAIEHGASDDSFTWLSLQNLTGFFMMFGLVGLLFSRRLGALIALVAGAVAGALVVWLLTRLMMGMKKLQSDGTMRPASAAGAEGTVYLRIPAGGSGKVQVTVQGTLCTMEARAKAPDAELKTGDHVRVVAVTPGNVLVVEKIG